MRKSIGQKASAVLHKAKVAASTSKERIGKLIPHSSSSLDEQGGAHDTRRVARLDTKFFATPDRAIAADKTYGLIKFEIQEAELDNPDRYGASVAIGEQTFASAVSDVGTKPVWGASRNLVLQRGEATVARISVSRAGAKKKAKRELVGWCDVDLAYYFLESSGHIEDSREDGQRRVSADHDPDQPAKFGGSDKPVSSWHDLKSPSDFSKTVGRIRVQTQSATLQHLERQFWGRALKIADLNADGSLELHEFRLLMQAFGTELSTSEIEALYRKADADGSNDVSEEELARCLADAHKDGELSKLIKRCPVSGAELTPGDDWGNLIYMTLCMDQGSGHTLQGNEDPTKAGEAWMLKMSEWAPQSLGGDMSAGEVLDPKGEEGNFSRIIVYDRASHRLVEEQISPTLVLAMRNMYQSRMGAVMMRTGAYSTLTLMSQEEGRHMDSPESVKNIPTFLKSFSGEVDISEALDSLDSFKSFNEFFYRKLKPEARPIAQPKDDDVVVSAADCRLSAFATIDDATRCWIKGRKFSLAGLLADGSKRVRGEGGDALAPEFEGGSMFVFRLAPQDYHRFHFPVSGTIRSIRHVRGKLYTVNPIAVASTYANVFTQNKRAVVTIDSPVFGPVAVICIGATMVGSIVFTAEEGKSYSKGDELGFFAFGGSTVIAVFAKDKIAIDQDILHNSAKSLETLVKMGVRLGCAPNSPHLASPSVNAATIAELQSQTQHLAPLHEAMGDVHIAEPGAAAPEGAAEGDAGKRKLKRQATAIPVNRHLETTFSMEQSTSSSDDADDTDGMDEHEDATTPSPSSTAAGAGAPSAAPASGVAGAGAAAGGNDAVLSAAAQTVAAATATDARDSTSKGETRAPLQ